MPPAITGWDSALGTLLGAFLRGRAENQQVETLRKILDEQQRKGRGLEDTMGIQSGMIPLRTATEQEGTFGNAPFVSKQDTPYIPNSQFPQDQGDGGWMSTLGNALKTAGSYTLEGLTPGNAEAGPLGAQLYDTHRKNERAQNLADAIALAKAKAQNRTPGFTERMYEDYAKTHNPEAAMRLWEQNQQGGTGDLLAGELRKNPQALQDYIKRQTQTPPRQSSRLDQLKQEMTPAQWQEYIGGLGGGTPQIKDTTLPTGQVQRQGVAPKTGKVQWEQTLPGKPLQAQERKNLKAMQDGYAKILELEDFLTDKTTGKMRDVSGYTGWQGTEPISGWREKMGLDPDEAKFRNITKDILNTFVRANEGAVVPDEMMKRLESMSVAISNADASFPVNLAEAKSKIEQGFANTLDTAAGAGFDVSEQRLPKNYQEVMDRIQQRNQGGTNTKQQAPTISPQTPGGQQLQSRYRITSGVNKGAIVDSKEALMEMIQRGQLSPSDTYEEGR